jgi:hypothetical protein
LNQLATLAAIEVSDTEFLRLSDFERFEDGSGYRCQIAVGCGEFGCSRKHFYFDDLPQIVRALRESYRSLKGSVEMCQRYEKESVTFSATGRGHFAVKGFLTNYRDIELRFALDVDQTYMQPFVAAMERINASLHA